jgi:PPOX class probable F420-dependent enzyme
MDVPGLPSARPPVWWGGGMAKTIATTTEVDLEGLLEFVRPRHQMVLITARKDGHPQASPVTGGVDDEGRIVISTYPERAKTTNARRQGEASVLVLSDSFNDAWVQLEGTCEVIDPPESVEPLVDYYRSIAGEHPDWDEYRQAMRDQGKSLLRITPTRWSPIATGGFPPRLAD